MTEGHRLLLINDIHLDIDSTAKFSDPGDETSPNTLDRVVSEAARREEKSGEKIDAILIPGDFCRHGLAAPVGADYNNWDTMKKTM